LLRVSESTLFYLGAPKAIAEDPDVMVSCGGPGNELQMQMQEFFGLDFSAEEAKKKYILV